MVKQTTSAGLAVFITTGIALLLLAPATPAMPASGLDFQETDTTPAPSSAVPGETAQPDVLAVETSQPQGVPPVAPAADHGSVMFIENVGQWDDGARFQVWGGPAGTMWLAEDAIWITLLEPEETSRFEPHPQGQGDESSEPERKPFPDDRINSSPDLGVNIKLSFVGANPQPRIETFDRLDTVVSYFLGNDPELWRPEVPVWGGVRYIDLYPGVDLEFSGENGRMAPRLAVRPGADLGAVRLRVDGADAVSVDGDMLHLSTAAGDVIWPLLGVEGFAGGRAQAEAVDEAFNVVEPFARASFRRSAASGNQRSPDDNLLDLLYGTFLGEANSDYGLAIAVDGVGNACVAGYTASSNFPTTPGTFDPSYNGRGDTFVVKLDPSGRALIYATFLGGSGSDWSRDITVDGAGSAYVTGYTDSSDFPTTPNAFDTSYNGATGYFDAFVAKLYSDGSGLAYATFLGGSDNDSGWAIAVDGVGCAYVTGGTESNNFPATPGAFNTSYNSHRDAFVAKLNSDGSALTYATFLGGSREDYVERIAVDGVGSAYVTGGTHSDDFPTTPGAFDTSFNSDIGGTFDAFVSKLNQTGSALAYATFVGGRNDDYGFAITVNVTGNAYVTGHTRSSDFPTTPNAFDRSYNAGTDAFVAKLNHTGSGLIYATFLGGGDAESGHAIAVDGVGNAYVTGGTSSSDFPTSPDAFDTSFNGGGDAFVTRLDAAGSELDYATFLGGSQSDSSSAVAVDGTGSAYVTGSTNSNDFPKSGAFDPTYNGNSDAFVAKLAMAISTPTPPRRYVPLVLQRSHPLPNTPVLQPITPPNANPSYTIRWAPANWATSYVLQRATNASFADATQVYAGTGTSTTIASQGIARYYYRVKARNQWGDSPWSNVQSVEVRWEQEPNYPVSLANGPLVSRLDYYGYPNDAQDYFTFQTTSRSQITIDLTNHTDQHVQLLLYQPAGNLVAQVYQSPYHLVYTGDPGAYYVQIYSTGGFNTTTPYTLRAAFP